MNKKTLWITGAAVAAVLIGGSAVAVAVADDDITFAAANPVVGSLSTASPAPSSSAVPSDDIVRAAEAAVAEVPGEVVDVDRDDDSTHAYEVDVRRADGTIAEVRLDAAFGVVSVREDGRDDDPSPEATLSAADADRAGAAALAHVGSGTVVEVKRDDDPGVAWEVEIDLGGDEDVDVELDADLRVLQVKD
ncbi:PepSY domain-containing protein [Planococcus sp. APC 4015]|nr:PepSY domain-containing protein [Planococcus sp. APC 4015]